MIFLIFNMSAIEKLQEQFSKFPGIGPRQAQRFVYFLLHRDRKYVDDLISNIHEARESVKKCKQCFQFFTTDKNSEVCHICSNPVRDTTTLMIVSRDADLQSIESSHVYNGLYFVLGGNLTFFKKHPEQLRIKELKDRIAQGEITEVIVATNANPEGELTADFLKKELQGETPLYILGRGLSTGIELEYSDEETLKSALENKKKL